MPTWLPALPRIVAARCLPLELNYVRVYVQDQPVPLLYVGPGQVNFLMSSVETAGPVKVRVVTEGITGPEIVGHAGGCGAGAVSRWRADTSSPKTPRAIC
jgi:uncharacterized protein (TIGR03437 family)